MEQKIRWGVMGCAGIVTKRFLPAMESVKNGVLCAVASRSANNERYQRLRREYPDVKFYDSYEGLLLDPDIDAVYLPAPNGLHHKYALQALRAKKHVLCEKPLGCSVREEEEMFQTADENGVLLMEAFACLHSPLFSKVRRLIDEDAVGNVKVVNAFFSHHLNYQHRSNVADKSLGGGALLDTGGYAVLSIRQITGKEPVSVKAMCKKTDGGVDAGAYALMDMGDVIGIAQVSLEAVRRTGFTVHGDKGYLTYSQTTNAWGELKINYVNASGQREVTLHVDNPYTAEIEQFGRSILFGEPLGMSREESLNNIRAMEMIRESMEEQE